MTASMTSALAKLLVACLAWLEASLAKLTPKLASLLSHLIAAIEQAGDDLGEGLVRQLNLAVARWLSRDPQLLAAFDLMGRDLEQALAADYLLVLDGLLLALLMPLLAAGVPLAYKAVTCRRQRVFISYNNCLHGPASAEVEQALVRAGAMADRMAFRADAQHDEVQRTALDLATAADTLVCLPGRLPTFVDNEVAVAYSHRKPLVFLVSELAGTLPGSADKRYPMFRLETTAALGFEPMVRFISYIGADLASTWSLCRTALAHPFMTLSAKAVMAGCALLSGLLWLVCYGAVHSAGHAAAASVNGELAAVAPLVAERLILVHTLLLGGMAMLVLSLGAFSALFILNFRQQLRARSRARLQTRAAHFNRDDWIGQVPGLLPDTPLYRCMFQTAPSTHHEAARPA